MALSRQALDGYDAALSKVERAAADYVRRRVDAYMASYPDASVADVRDFAIEVVNDAVGVYGDAASAAAADLYDELAEASARALPTATVDTSDVSRYVDKEVRYQASKLADGAPTEFTRRVAMCASDQVARRGNATMRLNASRDGIRWARVPMGGETCTFCAMLASRGFAYKSASTAGEGNHYHPNCRCKVVPETAGSVEGYDPGEWAERWRAMEEIDADPRLTAAQKLEAKGRISSGGPGLSGHLGSGSSPGGPSSPWEVDSEGVYDPADPESVKRFISDASARIVNEDIEHLFVLQSDGVVLHRTGGESTVDVDGADLGGAILVHNHPPDGGEHPSFGADDFSVLRSHLDIGELVAVSGPYTFHVRPTPRLSELTYNQAMRMADDETLEQGGEWQHAIMEGLSNAGYVVYRWEGGNTLPKRVG